MVPHSSTFAWKIPWMEESGGLQSMGDSTRSPVPVADHRQSVPTQEMLKHRSLGPTVHKVCLSPLSVSGGNGV